MFAFGRIVLTRFPFTDLFGDKRRPALVVSRDNQRRTELVVCFITSVPHTGPDIAPIAANPGTGLKVPSVVRFDKLVTLDPAVITGKLGDVSAAWLASHRATFWQLSVRPIRDEWRHQLVWLRSPGRLARPSAVSGMPLPIG